MFMKIIMNKFFALPLFFALISFCILTADFSSASTVKPTVPEFTIKLFDSSYDIPATISIDPYTGQQITTVGSHIEQGTAEIRIKNVPFTPFEIKDANNNTIQAGFFYNIRNKPHFSPESDWENDFGYDQYLNRSSGAETVYRINMTTYYDGRIEVPSWSRIIPANAELDFQVQALIGGPNDVWEFIGQKSDWSNTQTITVDESTPTVSPDTATSHPSQILSENQTPTASPKQSTPQSVNQLGFDWTQATVLLFLAVIAVLLLLVVILLRKRRVNTVIV